MSKVKVYVAVPSTGTVSDLHSWFFRHTEQTYGDRVELVYPKHCVHRKYHDFARNAHVEDFLASGADILFFLDSDVCPPDNLFDLVLDHDKWKLAGAPYPIFMTPSSAERPQVMMTVYKRNDKGLYAAPCPSSGREEVAGLATGCMFIKREVIEQLAKPYFEHVYDKDTRMIVEGEDLGFCRKVNELGFNFLVDYDMVCAHFKTLNLLDVNNYARDYAKRSVDQYAAMIKPALDQLSARVKASKAPPAIVPANNGDLKRIINNFRA